MPELPTPHGPAAVELDRPRSPRALFVVTHGAGGGVDTADLLALRDALTADGIAVARVLQPYRTAGRRTPPKPQPQDEAWLAVVAALRARRGNRALPLVQAGRSNGARVACRTAAGAGAAAVVALAFPLHPPGKPENSRLAELERSGVPTLVVQGTRDPFGMPPPGEHRRVVAVEGADHSLKRDVAGTAATVLDWLNAHIAGR